MAGFDTLPMVWSPSRLGARSITDTLNGGVQGQVAGGRADVQVNSARFGAPGVGGVVPVLQGSERDDDGDGELLAGRGGGGGKADQPPSRSRHGAVGTASVHLDHLRPGRVPVSFRRTCAVSVPSSPSSTSTCW
jgi:hypothetical protein